MLDRIHESHQCIVKCKQRARDILFWPGMSSQIEGKVSKCSICSQFQRAQPKEPMVIQELPGRPWAKIGSDLYSSLAFREFSNNYGFVHTTSSPTACKYPQANGQAERAVQTIESLFRRAEDPYKALLNYRNTPLKGVGLSPAQLLMSRRLKTSLPTHADLLKSDLL